MLCTQRFAREIDAAGLGAAGLAAVGPDAVGPDAVGGSAAGPRPLPGSLEQALTLLGASESAAEWLGPELHAAYLAFKRAEIKSLEYLEESEICRRYAEVY